MKQNNAKLSGILLLFIGVIVALALFPSIINTQSQMTELQPVTDETTNLTAVSCYASGEVNESSANCNITVDQWYSDWRASESQCYLSSVTVSNATGTALTLNTDYRIDSDAGIIQMLNTTSTNSTNLGENVLVDYSYCAEGYNADGSSRSMAGLFGLFAALAILAFAIFKAVPYFRELQIGK